MTGEQGVAALTALAAGALTCLVTARVLVERAPSRLLRINHRGVEIAAVLGIAVGAGGVVGLGAGALAGRLAGGDPGRSAAAVLAILVLLGAGGAADDLRGDEPAKGFSGHLRAALRGRITGGFVKIVAGAAAGIAAGWIVASGRASIEIALLVALTANLLNLLDRAPGRASKVALASALPLLLLGPPGWVLASAGLWGAAAAALPADLNERAMLGDTGANPLGGVLGLGLGLSLSEPLRAAALVVVLALNLASERWSFSAVIERNRFLRAVDGAGRMRG